MITVETKIRLEESAAEINGLIEIIRERKTALRNLIANVIKEFGDVYYRNGKGETVDDPEEVLLKSPTISFDAYPSMEKRSGGISKVHIPDDVDNDVMVCGFLGDETPFEINLFAVSNPEEVVTFILQFSKR